MIDHALQHNTSLQNADRGISDLLSSGSSILTSLRDQRLTLKVCSLPLWLLFFRFLGYHSLVELWGMVLFIYVQKLVHFQVH